MTDTIPTVIEVPPPQAPPDPARSGTATPAVAAAALPGMPLMVAGANAVGTATAGALAIGGPTSLAAAGVAAGAVTIGALARRTRDRARMRNAYPNRTGYAAPWRRNSGMPARPGVLGSVPAARRTSDAGFRTGTTAGGWSGGLRAASRRQFGAEHAGFYPATGAARTTTTHGHTTPAVAAAGRRGTGSAASRSASGWTGATSGLEWGGPGSNSRSSSATSGRPGGGRGSAGRTTAGSGGPVRAGVLHRPGGAVHTLAKAARPAMVERWQVKNADRAAKTAERTTKRQAKGRAAAERAAGIDPVTGAGIGVAGKSRTALTVTTPAQKTALRRSAARHAARMAAAGLITGLVGALSVAAFNWRHKGVVSSQMRRTWWRLAGRAREVRAARDAAIRGALGAFEVPVPATSVNVPGRTTTNPVAAKEPGAASGPGSAITLGKSTVKESTVSDSESTVPAFSLSSAADVMLQAATTFDPEQMVEFQQLADDLPVAFQTIQEVLRVLAEKSAESLPMDPAVVEEIGQGYQAMTRVVTALEEVGAVYRRAHEADIDRSENPRNGIEAERKWNV